MKIEVLLFVLSISSLSYAQLNQRTYIVSNKDCISQNLPKRLIQGDTVVVHCDSMYLLNKTRYTFYKELHEAIKLDDDRSCQELIAAFETSLIEQEESYKALLENAQKADSTTTQSLQNTKAELAQMSARLEIASEALERSQAELRSAQNNISKGQRKSNRQKLFFGAGGVVAGLIIGILLTQ